MGQSRKVALLMGGRSGEHEVSLVSGYAIAQGLKTAGFEVTCIAITPDGRWVLPSDEKLANFATNPRSLPLGDNDAPFLLEQLNTQNFDVAFPILHGTFGEDGTLQGLLEMLQIPYVGSGVLASSLCMDKDLAKKVFAAAGIPVVPYRVFYRRDWAQIQNSTTLKSLEQEFGFPFFVKPANSGSSVGVHKVKNAQDFATALKDAFLYDTKVLVERAINAREIECSVLGHNQPRVSVLGEILPRHEFYSYKAKYLDEHGADYKIPAEDLSAPLTQRLRDLSVQAFLAAQCSGLARVDFFVDRTTNEVFINEINTLPGFTPISMYPKLWAASGLNFTELLTRLIELACERSEEKKSLKTKFT